MASTDARAFPTKNTAYRVTFPIFDADGDLVTGATGLDSEVSKDGGTFADCTNEATEIATSSGMYYLDLTSTEMNADTVAIIVKTSSSGAKTTPMVFYPATLTVAQLGVNAVQIGATVQTGRDLGASVLLSSGTGTGQISLSSGAVLLQATQTGVTIPTVTTLTNLPAITSNWLTAAGIAASALNGKGDWNIGKTGYALSSGGIQAIWDALTSALSTASSIGKLLVDNLNATISSRLATAGYTAPLDAAGTRSAVGLASANLDTQLTAIDDLIDSEVAAILADTNELQTDWVNGGRLDLILDARASQTSVDDIPTNAELTTALGTADDATLAAIAALNNISTAQVTAAVPTAAQNAAAVLAAAVLNPIDANVQEVNDVALTGDGSATPWGPA